METFELRISPIKAGEIHIENFDEAKAYVIDKAESYKKNYYSEDNKSLAKEDRTRLNKFRKVISDMRIAKKKEYLEPFNDFEEKMKELVELTDEALEQIDSQVKAFDEKRKAEKQKAIEELFSQIGFQNFVTLEKIWDPKWLNASTSMKSIEDQMRERMYKIGNDVLRISQFAEFSFEAMEAYKEKLLMDDALIKVESERAMAQKKAAAKAAQQATVHEPTFPVRFEAIVTEEQAVELAAWFAERHIQFKQIR